jgi:hypothetical protein
MVDVKHRTCESCDKHPAFNIPGEKRGRFCSEHKLDGMVNVKNPKCKLCGLFVVMKFPYTCQYCTTKRTKKEHQIRELLETEFGNLFIHNKALPGAVGVKGGVIRPDHFSDVGTHFLWVETDENQHKDQDNYPCLCEYARIFNGCQAAAKPGYIIRYNPDAFHDSNGVAIRVPTAKRQAALIKRIKECLITPPTKPMQVEFMYYDESRAHFPEWEELVQMVTKLMH